MKTIARYVKEPRSTYSSDSVKFKIANLGTEGLSDAQLLSVFINSRSKDKSDLELAVDILNEAKSIDALVNMDSSTFLNFTGLGLSAFVKFKAAIELDRRRVFAQTTTTDVLTSPGIVREFLARQLSGVEDEVFAVVLMDNRHRVIDYREIGIGTIDSAAVYPRSVVKHALETNSAALVCVHNHPSGVAEPSDTDVRLTRKLTDALALIDCRVLDHIIIGQGVQTSLAERGLM